MRRGFMPFPGRASVRASWPAAERGRAATDDGRGILPEPFLEFRPTETGYSSGSLGYGFLISLTYDRRKQKISCPLLLELSRACRRRSSARRVTGGSTRVVVRPARVRSS